MPVIFFKLKEIFICETKHVTSVRNFMSHSKLCGVRLAHVTMVSLRFEALVAVTLVLVLLSLILVVSLSLFAPAFFFF